MKKGFTYLILIMLCVFPIFTQAMSSYENAVNAANKYIEQFKNYDCNAFEPYGFLLSGPGEYGNAAVYETPHIRPVISLKDEVIYNFGDGNSSNPYTIKY